MQKACLPPRAFADIMLRLENQMLAVGDKKEASDKQSKASQQHQGQDVVSEILSSHPDTQARVKPFLEAKQSCN
jgi:hypothetical protein